MNRRSRGGRRPWLALTAALAPGAVLTALLFEERWRGWWTGSPWSRALLLAHLLSVAACCWGGLLLVRKRPGNLCGILAVGLGIDLGLFYIAGALLPARGWWPFAGSAIACALRPLAIGLVLAWPTGRLDRTSRLFMAVYLPFTVVAYVVDGLGQLPQEVWADKPIGLWPAAPVTYLVASVAWDIGGLLVATALLIVAWRRRLRFRGAVAQALSCPGWWAAVVLASGDLVLFGLGPLRRLMSGDSGVTPFGALVQIIDIARWGVAVGVLAFGARTVWRLGGSVAGSVTLDARIDIPLRATVAAALRDPFASVAVRLPGGRWVDEEGGPRPAPAPGADRAVTLVARGGATVAAIEHTAALAGHPAVLDGAAAALALRLDALRQLAMAELRSVELRRLGRDLLEAEDEARRHLERDLHDGTQQTLVGLALHASLAARTAQRREDERPRLAASIADAVERARDELATIAAGRPPALLAERGLSGALSALAVTAGLPVTVDVARCDDLPPGIQRALWFTAAEAVGNALKHAAASHLTVRLTRDQDAVALEVADDGVGGLTAVPRALFERVAESDGRLDMDSRPGGGTRVTVVFRLTVDAAA